MKIIKAYTELYMQQSGIEMLKHIERCGRICYKSESKITHDSCFNFVRKFAIEHGHESMLEHCSFSVLFVVDRGISHELVRHRIASFSQESTRYCNYRSDRFCDETIVIRPVWLEGKNNSNEYLMWENACNFSEKYYFELIEKGWTAQQARSVLPNSLKTEVMMTANLREWRYFFKLRAVGEKGKPHQQMLEVTIPLLGKVKNNIPVVFDDIIVNN